MKTKRFTKTVIFTADFGATRKCTEIERSRAWQSNLENGHDYKNDTNAKIKSARADNKTNTLCTNRRISTGDFVPVNLVRALFARYDVAARGERRTESDRARTIVNDVHDATDQAVGFVVLATGKHVRTIGNARTSVPR